jgi:hypothetical protein
MSLLQIARLSLFCYVGIFAFNPNRIASSRSSLPSSITLGMNDNWKDINYFSTSELFHGLSPEIHAHNPLSGLELLMDNFYNLISSAIPSLENGATQILDRIQIESYGAWYVAAFCLLLAAFQREAGREEAFREFRDKIWLGEITIEEVSVFVTYHRDTYSRVNRALIHLYFSLIIISHISLA